MISNSSKRLSKIKKKLTKNDPTDYQFLISSLSRQNNKQNNPINKSQYDVSSIKYSIQLKKPSAANSVDKYRPRMNNSLERGQFSKINLKNSPVVLFENVKFLKSSRMDVQSSQNRLNVSKQTYRKNIQLSQKAMSKQNTTSINKKSQKLTQNLEDSFQTKLQAYVSFVNEFVDDIFSNFKTEISNHYNRKKSLLTTLSKQILRQISIKNETIQANLPNKSIEVSHFCSFPSKVMSKQLQKSAVMKQKSEQVQFKKIIDDLSQKNSQLNQLISEHERKNIKLFIQMNENESKQIEKCKKYLSSLYDKYKILEKSLVKQNKKYQQAIKQNQKLQKQIKNIDNTNKELQTQIQKLRSVCQQRYKNSKTSFKDDQNNTMFDFSLNEKKHTSKSLTTNINLSIAQKQKPQKSFLTKRQKVSSCIKMHSNNQKKEKQDDLMSCSTITKNKNMKKKKPSSPNKIHGKSRYHEITDQDLNLKFKKQIGDLKNKLFCQISQKQNLQKKFQTLSRKNQKLTEKLTKIQKIVNQQMLEIENLMKVNIDLTDQIKVLNKEKQKNEMKQEKNKILQKIRQTQRMFEMTLKRGANKFQDQYRIIAMQAQALQQLINFP